MTCREQKPEGPGRLNIVYNKDYSQVGIINPNYLIGSSIIID